VIEKLHMSAILMIAAALWGCMLIIEGLSITPAYFHPFSTVLGVIMALLGLFDVWLWRLKLLQGWFVKRPVLNGTWRAEIRSNWVDPATGLSATTYRLVPARRAASTSFNVFL
jgi:SMODS-associating 2TM, beta-strand rich effector domain